MDSVKNIPVSCDVVVIGAGLGGLICALELQKHGQKVVVVEKRKVAGGYAHHFKRGEYTFDASLHHIGGLEAPGMANKLLSSLDVLKRLKFERAENLFIAEFPDAVYEIPNTFDDTIAYLGELFPEDAEGIKQLFGYSRKLKKEVISPVLLSDLSVEWEKMISLSNVDKTFEDILDSYIKNIRLKAILGQLWMYLGLPPSKSSANFSNCVFASGFVESRYKIHGGSKALVDALVESFIEKGGCLILGQKAERIEISDKVVTGVSLADGTVVKTDFVAANVSPLDNLSGLVEDDKLSKVFKHRLEMMEPSYSVYSLYLGLDCKADKLGIKVGNTFHNYGNDLDAAFDNATQGNIEKTDWCVACPEDDGMAPEGKSSINIVEVTSATDWFSLSEAEYKNKKAEVLDRLLDKYEKKYPGLKKHSVVNEFGTPRTVKRYSGNSYGSLYGFAQTVAQSNNRRISNRMPVKGLYLCGAWTQAGGGYEGTMMSGMKSAHMILEEKSVKWNTGIEMTDKPVSADVSTKDYKFYSNTYTVYPDDTDFTGNAKETAFLRFTDRARVRLMHQSPELEKLSSVFDSYYVKLYSITAHFHKNVGVGESVDIQTGYRRATSHRAAVDHIIIDNLGQPVFTAQAEIMFVTRQEQLMELPDIYRVHGDIPFKVPAARLPKQLFADLSNHKFEEDFLISYEDTDMQGVVYNVSYVKIAQKMFWEISDKVLPVGVNPSSIRTEHLEVRFMNAARLADIVTVKAGYRPIDEKHFGVDYRMFLNGTGTTLTDIHIEYEIFE
ncbi:MAG: FAD-dependent oxidoreductase [Spirochaetales bacterium]|nr:FAD-dependent oxidoreductase [Spirochaetales bacterium]